MLGPNPPAGSYVAKADGTEALLVIAERPLHRSQAERAASAYRELRKRWPEARVGLLMTGFEEALSRKTVRELIAHCELFGRLAGIDDPPRVPGRVRTVPISP